MTNYKLKYAHYLLKILHLVNIEEIFLKTD